MDIDLTQWVNHIVSVVFGGAGGIGAGLAKYRATVKNLEDRLAALEKAQAISVELEKTRAATIEALEKELAAFREIYSQHNAAMERSLGSIEGTVNQIARNGCANRCTPLRYPVSVSDFPKVGPKR